MKQRVSLCRHNDYYPQKMRDYSFDKLDLEG